MHENTEYLDFKEKTFPVLSTERLILREFHISDSEEVKKLAGAKEVARGTYLPHPYEDGMAEKWIKTLHEDFKRGDFVNFAIVDRARYCLIGSIGLSMEKDFNQAQLGYWIGVDFWGNGYCTEAAREVLRYGFDFLKLDIIYAIHFTDNAASGRVLQKIGMKYEGSREGEYLHMGELKDVDMYCISEYDYRNNFSEVS